MLSLYLLVAGTAYLFQARVQVYFHSSEPFLTTPVAEVVMLYTNLWANCLTSSQQVVHCSLQEQYSSYTAGSTLCAKRGEARENECELCLVYGAMCNGWMTQGWKIQVGWLSQICLGFATHP